MGVARVETKNKVLILRLGASPALGQGEMKSEVTP
jgi:hypothetical protein